MRRTLPLRPTLAFLGACLCLAAAAGQARAGAPDLPARHVVLDLPGPPASIIPADLNGDGRMDLAVAVLYSEYEDLEFEKAQGFVQITEIVPALFERRQLRAWLQRPDDPDAVLSQIPWNTVVNIGLFVLVGVVWLTLVPSRSPRRPPPR